MTSNADLSSSTLTRDIAAGSVVFLVALPLCLGVALASNAPLLSGVLAGVIGGILVGMLSGSQSSVSGPAAGLTAVVAAQVTSLGSFQTFLLALVIAGLIQIALGVARAGFLAAFFPSSVIKGLLAAIGVILILKQIPHVLGHDPVPQGDLSFFQRNRENTFSELAELLGNIQPGSAVIGLLSIALLIVWSKWERLKQSGLPIALVVVLLGVGLNLIFGQIGGRWAIGASHLVQVPMAESLAGYRQFLLHPDFSQWANPAVYVAALTLAAVASLEGLLNLEAIDKLDPQQRVSPPSRELWAQGIGNVVSGLVGGLPVTPVVIRSSVSLHSGSTTRLATIVHGGLLLITVTLLPAWLNLIPLSSLAAILLVTGFRLASPVLFRQMWNEGRYQFLPFLLTVVAIVLIDPLTGILIGLAVSTAFILSSNVRRPLRRTVEKHLGGDVIRIKLATQVSFLNRAALAQALNEVPRGGHILLDAHNTDYIDADVLSLIRDFKEQTAPARGVEVSLRGFRSRYELQDQTQYVNHSSRDIQTTYTPSQVLQLLKDGHERFRTGQRLTRDLTSQVIATASGQHPLAVVVSCIDSRTPAELLFDLGVGDIFSVRIAGNITSRKVMGSVEYACTAAGAKLILVLGHTRCGAVTAAVNFASAPETAASSSGCEHIEFILRDIQKSIDPVACQNFADLSPSEKDAIVNDVSRRNVARVVEEILQESPTLNSLVQEGRLAIAGTIYDVATGNLEFLPTAGCKDTRVLNAV